MSNIVYDFLVDSFLFTKAGDNYSNVPLQELIEQLNNYRIYVDSKIDEIKEECIDKNFDYSITSPLSLTQKNISIEEIVNGSLFLDRYIVDDPLYPQNYNDLRNLNHGRKLHGLPFYSEEIIKRQISEACQFLMSITPFVRNNVAYVKVLPLTSNIIEENWKSLNIPTLSLDHIDDNTFEWMTKRLEVFDFTNNTTKPLNGVTDSVLLAFKGDSTFFSAVYGKVDPIFDNNGNVAHATVTRSTPTNEQFDNWILEEKIKAIRDKHKHILLYHSIANELKTTTGIASVFDSKFLAHFLQLTSCSSLSDLGLNLKIPFVKSQSIDRIADIRERCGEDILRFRMQLREDSQIISNLKTEEEVRKYVKETSLKYEEQARDLLKILSAPKGLGKYVPDILIGAVNYITMPSAILASIMNSSIAINSKNMHSQVEKGNPYLLLSKIVK